MPSRAESPLFAPDAELVGTRALVVDDDPDLLELLDALLRTFGVDTTLAHSGNDAFAKFVAQRPDIVISDIQMRDGSGLDLVRQIRALPPERGGLTPAIAMSGAVDVQQALDAGFHFHFAKPASAAALLEAIRSFVREEQSGHETWSVGVDHDTIVVRLEGHVTGGDMRAMTSTLVPLLELSKDGARVISDLRRLKSFTPSVGVVGQLGVWRARDKIRSVVVVGGSQLARAISRGACAALGIECSFSETIPS